MNDTEFEALAGQTLAAIEQALEQSGADLDFQLMPGGVLEIEFANGSKIIVNRHAIAKEIWVAAKSGGFHFRWQDGAWRDTRDAAELMSKLEQLASAQAGEPISFSR